ncbi:helix-turn-helix transcriptional regulator [Streptomyces sp. NPDC002809]|uniref:PadR family transcriptional regulator n=1 Tax=Streptomyces sp. NPDC002809 TaxID=3154433 RepID=UPI003332E72F
MLALLAVGPAHGYQLKHEYDALSEHNSRLAYAQVYTTLIRLERDCLIAVTGEGPAIAGPPRTLYRLLPTGLAQPPNGGP